MTAKRSWPFWFAVVGNLVLLVDAVVRMLGAAASHAAKAEGAGVLQWSIAAVVAVAFAYGEGHHALARRFVPMVVERAVALHHGHRWARMLAPLTAAGLCFAPKDRLLRSWTLIVGIVVLVVAMRALPPAIRAGVDLGVGLALAWGALALARQAFARSYVASPIGQLTPVPPMPQ